MSESQFKRDSSSRKKESEKKRNYNARFVKENPCDRHRVKPNECFLKSWTFRNNGEVAWPEESAFIQTNGDDLGAQMRKVNPINVNEEVTIEMMLTAPALPGKYCAFFRFVYGDNQRYGQKVWCDILVDESLVQSEMKDSIILVD